jgi:hypothetical protein
MLLLDGPEALSDEGAEFCVEAGIGFISEPIRVWKAARSKERGLNGKHGGGHRDAKERCARYLARPF